MVYFSRYAMALVIAAALMVLAGCGTTVLDPDDYYENAGVLEVTTEERALANSEETDRPLPATLYRPANGQSGHLIVLLHGFGAKYTNYERYAKHLASHGFWVLGFNFLPSRKATDGEHDYRARQVVMAIDDLFNDADYGNLLPAQVGILGHSMGGKVAFMASTLDSRIAAIVALDPVNSGGPPCAIAPDACAAYPTAPNPSRGAEGVMMNVQATSLILRSRPDPLLAPDSEFNAQWFYYGSDGQGLNGAPSPAYFFDMGGASHAAYLPALGGKVVQISQRSAAAFFDQVLKGVDNSRYLNGELIQRDVSLNRLAGIDARL